MYKHGHHRQFLFLIDQFLKIFFLRVDISLKGDKLEAQYWAEPVSLTFHSALRKLNTEPSIGASHQISAHFGQAVSEKKIFRNWSIRNKNCLWWPCLYMDRDEISTLYRGPHIDASYQDNSCLKYRYLYSKCFYLYTDFFKSSPLNLLGQMNRNLVGSIYGRSSVKIAHFVPIR
jgi:hypothetical protein